MKNRVSVSISRRGRGAGDQIPGLMRKMIQLSELSQAEVARRVGMQPTHLNAFLNGRGDIHSRRAFDLLEELGLSVEERLAERIDSASKQARPKASEETEMISLRGLGSADRSAVLKLLKRLTKRPSLPRPR